MNDIFGSLTGPFAELGFGGFAGFVVGFTTKKAAKVIAIALGALFIGVQVLAYYGMVEVHWETLQNGAEQLWQGNEGVTLAEKAWHVISYNLPFGGGFLAGFALGLRRG